MGRPAARRFRGLAESTVLGIEVPVAGSGRSRLLGLAWLDLDQAGHGLLLPRCRSVHTFGMRFRLDLFFLDGDGRFLEVHRSVGPRRVVSRRGARAVLELPAGGETGPAGT